MFRFENTYYLYALALIPLFIILFMLMKRWKKKSLKNFGESFLIKQLMPDASKHKLNIKFLILMIAYIFLVLGLANPQIGSKLEKVKRKGSDLIIALDVSNSMLAQDIKPSRLEKSKNAISQLIDKLTNDRIGIIVFAGKPYVQLPITTDYGAAKMFLSTINTNIISSQGTDIGAAIELAYNSFGDTDNKKDNKNKSIIIISDGEDQEDNAVEISKNVAGKGITINTIGIGSTQGAPIPVSMQSNRFKKDRQGNTVITKLNQTMLEQIASTGNGIYVQANNTEIGLNKIFRKIDKLNKKEYESKVFTEYEDRFQYFIAISLFLLILELFIFERKSKLFRNVNLFKPK